MFARWGPISEILNKQLRPYMQYRRAGLRAFASSLLISSFNSRINFTCISGCVVIYMLPSFVVA